jgi:hypothetical protein
MSSIRLKLLSVYLLNTVYAIQKTLAMHQL